ncbi:MAG TPA: hypothetical protein VNC40_09255 [Gaiellaceae bacterium]|nr:hypothetical protein [Gaiellaceae bacterium]
MPELGLVPLPIVLVPTERIPLHIFEPRYRELMDEHRRRAQAGRNGKVRPPGSTG